MQLAQYYTIRRAIQSNAPAPDRSAVTALETELRAALVATGFFHSVEVGSTDDADRHVIALCAFAPEVDPSEAAVALARLWMKQVAYGFWRAETMRVDQGHVELQGATRLGIDSHYATVHIVAQEAPAPAGAAARPAALRTLPGTGAIAAG